MTKQPWQVSCLTLTTPTPFRFSFKRIIELVETRFELLRNSLSSLHLFSQDLLVAGHLLLKGLLFPFDLGQEGRRNLFLPFREGLLQFIDLFQKLQDLFLLPTVGPLQRFDLREKA